MTEVKRPRAVASSPTVPDRLRRPIHFGALLGVSTGLYATTLAGTAVLQQQADDSLALARSPAVAKAAELRAGNDRLAQTVDALSRRQAALSSSYDGLRANVADAETTLGGLATIVAEVRGAAAALPQRIALPAIPSVRVAPKASRAHATTGGSAVP
jgi:hypothetical protein